MKKVRARNTAYKVARFLGDAQAASKGNIGKRILNKLIGRFIVSKLWIR